MEEVAGILRKGVNYLATIDGDRPAQRPFGAAIMYEGEIYLFTSKKKAVCKQIEQNSKVEIVVMTGEMEWARIAGEAFLEPRREIIEAFLADDPELADYYGVDDGKSMPLRIKVLRAELVEDGDVIKNLI